MGGTFGRGERGRAGLAASRRGWLCTSAGRSRQMGRRGVKISMEIREAFLANQSPPPCNDSLAAQGENTTVEMGMGMDGNKPRAPRLAVVAGGPQPPRAPLCEFIHPLPLFQACFAPCQPATGRGVPCVKLPWVWGGRGVLRPPDRAEATLLYGGTSHTGTQLWFPLYHPAWGHRIPPGYAGHFGAQSGLRAAPASPEPFAWV